MFDRATDSIVFEQALTSRTGQRSIVVSTLGITQTLAWGSTHYLTVMFADPVSASLPTPCDWFFGIFSAALLLSGVLGPHRRPDDRSAWRPQCPGRDKSGVRVVAAVAAGPGWLTATRERRSAHLAGIRGRSARRRLVCILYFG